MDARELRIGNLVYDPIEGNEKRIGEIFCIEEAEVKIGVHYSGFDEIFPIPLTEDWLKRLGVHKNELETYTFPGKKFSGRWITKKQILEDDRLDNPFLRFDGIVDIYYVHQLQNLYSLTTGEELTIKDKVL